MARLAGPEPAREVARAVFGDSFGVVDRYAELLATTGVEWGLLGPRESGRIWDRHILNSVALAALIGRDVAVLDMGSGAGLPGIPLALARDDLSVTLLEPMERRVRFLTEVALVLDLAVQVVRGRAEEHRCIYDVVVARAVATLPKLAEWGTPLLRPGGRLLAMKGDSAAAELDAAAEVLARLGRSGEVVSVRACAAAEPTQVVVIE